MLTQAREMGVEEFQDTITGTTVEHQKAAGAKEVAKAITNQQSDSEPRDEHDQDARGSRDRRDTKLGPDGFPECHCIHVTQLLVDVDTIQHEIDFMKANAASDDPWFRQ